MRYRALPRRAAPLSNGRSPDGRVLLALLHAVDDALHSTTFDDLAHRPIAHLHALAGPLRAYNPGALERVLWASAVEPSTSSS